MANKIDGTHVSHDDALRKWTECAYNELKSVARTYNSTVSYIELAERIQSKTEVRTNMLVPNWIGDVLDRVAKSSADRSEPPITSLCIRSDGTIGDGYDKAVRIESASTAPDIELRAAEDRLICYQTFSVDLPSNQGRPTLTPEVEDARRRHSKPDWLDSLIKTGRLSAQDPVSFRTHTEAARLFGFNYKSHQKATIPLGDSTYVWFPKLFKNRDWDNYFSPDGQTIIMRPIPGGQYANSMKKKPARDHVITFGHVKKSSNSAFYKFVGVFEIVPQLSTTDKWVYQKVSETITFDGSGAYSFNPIKKISQQDDQRAEASDIDPNLVAEFKEKIEFDSFSVSDQYAQTKVRGSAQEAFAHRVKSNYGWACAVTGITTRAFLVASHIIPWSQDKEVRLDPSNGICLSTFVDRAFDAGFIEIKPDSRTSVRWDRIQEDPILKSHLTSLDDVELARPQADPPDPEKLTRRIELGF